MELTAEQLKYMNRQGQIGYSLERRRRPIIDKIMKETKKRCEEQGVDFWNWVATFRGAWVKNYSFYRNSVETLPKLYDRTDEEAQYLLKNITQNDFVFGRAKNIQKVSDKFEHYKKLTFDWLDEVEDPYFFILTPLYFYNTYVYLNGYDCYPDDYTGLTDENITLAADYAKYKLRKNLL